MHSHLMAMVMASFSTSTEPVAKPHPPLWHKVCTSKAGTPTFTPDALQHTHRVGAKPDAESAQSRRPPLLTKMCVIPRLISSCHTNPHLMAMVMAPFSTPTEPAHNPTRPPVSSPSVAANLQRQEDVTRAVECRGKQDVRKGGGGRRKLRSWTALYPPSSQAPSFLFPCPPCCPSPVH